MAKALIGHLPSDLRASASQVAENRRLRRRVEELETLVLRLQAENDRLATAETAALLQLDDEAQRLQPV